MPLMRRSDASVYDLFYLALADRSGGMLLSADKALLRHALALDVAIP